MLTKRLKQQEVVMQMVAHEMRTPLSIVIQFLGMLRILCKFDEGPDQNNASGEELRQGLIGEGLTAEDVMGNIELQVNLLMSFVNDLLDLARIDEGLFNLNKAEFSFQ